MKLILHYLTNYKKILTINIICVLGFALVELGIPTILAKIIDYGIANNDIDYIKKMSLIMVLVSIIGVSGVILMGYYSAKISTSVTRDIRNDIFEKSQKFSHNEYNKFGVASMITRTTNDAFQIQQFINVLLRTALIAPVMFIVSLIMILITNVPLSLVLIITLPFIIIGVIIIAKISKPLSEKQQKGLDILNLISRENLTGIRVIRAFGNDEYESKRFIENNINYTEVSKKLFKLMSLAQPSFFFIVNMAVVVVFWMASKMINLNTLQVGELVAFIEYLFHAMFALILFAYVFIMYPKAQVSANRIDEILKQDILVKKPVNGIKYIRGKGIIEFKNVTFKYPDGDEPVLKNISFSVKKGEVMAFIGSTGSGKSTLINLIPRFYDVTNGTVKINGKNIKEYDLASLRNNIGFVPQNNFLFKGSIKSNIRFGKKDADEKELEKVIEISELHEFISQKPKKLDDEINEGGKNVSGGQKQRLCIARAIVRNSEIYIFDDSFSALDFKTDYMLRSKLKNKIKNSTVLIVAQRISSIMNADRIMVLNEGKLVGCGTHKELLENCEVYKEIAASQLSKEELLQ